MICPNCHRILVKGEKFCPDCGTQIDETVDAVKTTRTQRFKKKRNQWKTIYYLLGAVIALAVGAYALFCIINRGEQTNEQKQPTVVLKIKEDEMHLRVGETKGISTNKVCEYIIEDQTVCKISGLGVVTALKEGKTTITCRSEDGQKVICTIVVAPEENVETEEIPVEDETVEESEYIFADSHQRLLTSEDLKGTTQEERRMAINEIYARHHCTFKNPEVIDYFSNKSWYQPDPNVNTSNVVAQFSEIETKNITTIRTYQE